MRTYCTAIAALLLMLFTSCSEDHVDGKWGDVIKFSTTNVSFDGKANSTVITSKGGYWISPYVGIDGEQVVELRNNPDFVLTTDNRGSILKIEGAWFTITRETDLKLLIQVSPNNTGHPRILDLPIQAGDYFTQIVVTQK